LPDLDDVVMPDRAAWDFGWSDHVTGSLAVVDIASDHLGLLRQPAVEQTGHHVARALTLCRARKMAGVS
jgi:thioesterase domain-containing protein